MTSKVYIQLCNIYIGDKKMENKIESKENKKFVLKIYEVYPVWGMGQLAGAIVCDDREEAIDIKSELREVNRNMTIEEMDEDYENALWKEWAEDVDRLARYNHDPEYDLVIMTADEYREKGYESAYPEWSDEWHSQMLYSEDDEFIGWYDVGKDAVVDAKGRVIAEIVRDNSIDDFVIKTNEGKFIKVRED